MANTSDDMKGATQPSSGFQVAYLVNQYPKVSHTFIRREILALERMGVTVLRFAFRGWDAEVADQIDETERSKTRYLVQDGLWPLFLSVARMFLRQPRSTFRALSAAITMSRNSLKSWPYHLIWFAYACRLKLWLEETKVRHLHAHFGTNSTDVAHLLHLLGGPSYSFTVHGSDECDNAGALSLPRKTGAARFVVTVSSYVRAQMMRRLSPADWPKLAVVHCGLDEDFFAKEPLSPPDQPALLCIGRLCAEKGHLVLLEAFAALDRPDLRLVLAGDGEFRELVEDRIRQHRLQDRVRITGWIGSDEVRQLIGQATLVVQPSLMEGLPVVLMEALAQGRPVVSTYIAGIPELVEDGRTGWLVPAGNVDALAETLKQALAAPPAQLAAMGRAGIARARARHHIDTEAGKLLRLFGGAPP